MELAAPISVSVELAQNYCKHSFNLLGSGWRLVHHGMTSPGFEGISFPARPRIQTDLKGEWLSSYINPSNLALSQKIWSCIDNRDYLPIDWQIDFRSGFRWAETTWYKDVRYGAVRGADVKLPWELGRLQHLVHLAWAYRHATVHQPGFYDPSFYLSEYRNQLLDFIAQNPPRFGVQWACTMDVAIRCANMLLSWDLMRGAGATFDAQFESLFTSSIYDHGFHIVNNLEWAEDLHANHYLANVAGLLFAAAYLPLQEKTSMWLGFAVWQLATEVHHQFNEDGSNFEASTSYHRLSAEMVAYSTAIALGLPESYRLAIQRFDRKRCPLPPAYSPENGSFLTEVQTCSPQIFPDWYLRRLGKIAQFTRDVTKASGKVVQIGDNDSGRFIEADPSRARESLSAEDGLDHKHLLDAIGALLEERTVKDSADGSLIRSLAHGWIYTGNLPIAVSRSVRKGDASTHASHFGRVIRLRKQQRYVFTLKSFRPERLDLAAYSDFGIYLFRWADSGLVIRCGGVGQSGYGGHAHNDQLSIELWLEGRDVLLDPGTYVYTAVPELRNLYRSIRSHFAPCVSGIEPNDLSRGLFLLRDRASAEVLYFGEAGFVGSYRVNGVEVLRAISFKEDQLEIIDAIDGEGELVPPAAVPFSPAYGVKTDTYHYPPTA